MSQTEFEKARDEAADKPELTASGAGRYTFMNGADWAREYTLREVEEITKLEARVKLFKDILYNIDESDVEETIDWMRSRYAFELEKLQNLKGKDGKG